MFEIIYTHKLYSHYTVYAWCEISRECGERMSYSTTIYPDGTDIVYSFIIHKWRNKMQC